MKGLSLKPSTAGLLPFEEKDTGTYYINEVLVEDFFRSLKKNKFIFLTGDQGSGKTSFLNCIVVRQISEYLENPGREWETVRCRPGLDPVKNLAHAIAMANINTKKPDVALEMEEMLRKGSNGMVEVFNRYPMQQNKDLLLVVDHLEDIFFLEKLEQDTRQPIDISASIQTFINLLWTFEKQSIFRVYIVVAFSNAFRERISEYPKLLDLAQKYNFRFEGVAVSETDQIIDKIVSPSLRSYTDIASLKRVYKEKLLAQQENGSLSPAWRYFLNHSLRRVLILWNRGFARIKDGLSKRSALKPLLKNKNLLLLVNDLLKNENLQGNLSLEDRSETLWNELQKEQQQQLLEIIRTAKAQGRSYAIIDCYEAGGGMETSIADEASELCAYDPAYENLAEFLIKTFTTRDAVLRPLQYGTIDKLTRSKIRIDQEKFHRFINHCGDRGLGLFQVISSSRIEERLNNISNAEHIDDDAVIAIRHLGFLQKDTPFEKWVSHEGECISEYLLYAQMGKKKTETYPTTLRLYADSLLAGTAVQKDRHSALIHEFLQKGNVWAALHAGDHPQFASFEETVRFINGGVKHWQMVKKGEESRKKEERRIKIIKRNLVLLVFAAVVFFGIHTRVSVEKHNMIRQLDCLHDDHLRVSSLVYNEYIYYLEGDSTKKGFEKRVIDSCWYALDDESKKVDSLIEEIYGESPIEFALGYSSWKKKRNVLLSESVRRGILQLALDRRYLQSKGGKILDVQGYKIFDKEWSPSDDVLYVVDCSQCKAP